MLQKKTIFARIRQGNLIPSSPGPEPPLKPIEPIICEVCVQCAKIGQPVNQTEGLQLSNSLIHKTCWQEKWKKFQQKISRKNKDEYN